MAKQEIKNKMNIGSSSLILIFIILCLTTFGLLSLSSAKNDLTLAERNADAVREYYRADSAGEDFVATTDRTLQSAIAEQTDTDRCVMLIANQLGAYYDPATGVIQTDIPMDRGQALHVELGIDCDEKVRYEILSWNVYNQEDYEIDDAMPVWTGQ